MLESTGGGVDRFRVLPNDQLEEFYQSISATLQVINVDDQLQYEVDYKLAKPPVSLLPIAAFLGRHICGQDFAERNVKGCNLSTPYTLT